MKEKTIEFIKNNREMLEEMFNERIEQLKDSIFNIEDNEKRDLEIRFVQEYKEWLRSIGIICKQNNKHTNKIYE
ncbi:MAG: hypothetical protein KBH94_05010 [Caldisericia bacterium]|nr:hypothetical protein [Caldisericia bacterium]